MFCWARNPLMVQSRIPADPLRDRPFPAGFRFLRSKKVHENTAGNFRRSIEYSRNTRPFFGCSIPGKGRPEAKFVIVAVRVFP
jgi:hypothetical protein